MAARIVSGGTSTFVKDTRGLGEFFFHQADKFGDKICQIDTVTGEKETFSQVKQRCTRVAIQMQKLGVSSEDVIMNCSKNSLDCAIPFLSTLYLNAKISSLDPSLSERECRHCINLMNPKLIFVQEQSVKTIERSIEKLINKPEIIVIGKSEKYKILEEWQMPCLEEKNFSPKVVSDCHETAIIFFSSGTTGLPKGICITHFSMINGSKNLRVMGLYEGSVFLTYSSFYWISAVLFLAISHHIGGIRVVPPKFDAEDMFRIIEKYKVSAAFIAPIVTYSLTNLDTAEKYDTSSLRWLLTGGTSLSAAQLMRTRMLLKHTKVAFGYGTTEALSVVTCFVHDRDNHLLDRLESVGKCVVDKEIKVVDPETRKLLGPNRNGEICVRTKYAMAGYYNIDASSDYDEDGFIKTGDIGHYDEDDCIYIVDRIKEMFKYKSWHVMPSSLEAILLEHPAVKEAGVFGLPHEIDEFHPAACIVLKEGCSAKAEEINKFFSDKVSDWHKLRGGIKFVEFMPRTPTWKLQRRKLKDLFLNN